MASDQNKATHPVTKFWAAVGGTTIPTAMVAGLYDGRELNKLQVWVCLMVIAGMCIGTSFALYFAFRFALNELNQMLRK